MPAIVYTNDEIQKYNVNGTFYVTGIYSIQLPFLYTNVALTLCFVLFVLALVYIYYLFYVIKSTRKAKITLVKEPLPLKPINDENVAKVIGNTAHSSKHEEVNEKNYEDFIKESQSQLKLAAPTSRQNQQRFFLPVSSPNRYIPSRVHLSQISMTNNSLSVIDDNFSATSLNAPSLSKEQQLLWTSPSYFRDLLRSQWPKQIYQEPTSPIENPFDQDSLWSTRTELKGICKAQLPTQENETSNTVVNQPVQENESEETLKNEDLDNKEEVKIVNDCGILVESVTELADNIYNENQENQEVANQHISDGEFDSKISSIESNISSSKRSSLTSIKTQSGLSSNGESEYDNSMKNASSHEIAENERKNDEITDHIIIEQNQSNDTLVNEFASQVSETPSNFMDRLQSASNKSFGSSQKPNALMSEGELSTTSRQTDDNPSNSTVDLLIRIEAHESLSQTPSNQNELSSCTGVQIESNRTSIDEEALSKQLNKSNKNNNNNKPSETSLVNIKHLASNQVEPINPTNNVRLRIEQFEKTEQFKKSLKTPFNLRSNANNSMKH